MACLKQQSSLTFTFCKTKILRENHVDLVVKIVLSEAATGGVLYRKLFLKFTKYTGKHLCQGLFFNKFAGVGVVFTYCFNLKIFEHSLEKVREIFNVLPKQNLKSACKR